VALTPRPCLTSTQLLKATRLKLFTNLETLLTIFVIGPQVSDPTLILIIVPLLSFSSYSMADHLEEVKVFVPLLSITSACYIAPPPPPPPSIPFFIFSQGLVTRTLDAQGVLAKLKAEIRSHVFTGSPSLTVISQFAANATIKWPPPSSFLTHPTFFPLSLFSTLQPSSSSSNLKTHPPLLLSLKHAALGKQHLMSSQL
jgi:hypothetical protein